MSGSPDEVCPEAWSIRKRVNYIPRIRITEAPTTATLLAKKAAQRGFLRHKRQNIPYHSLDWLLTKYAASATFIVAPDSILRMAVSSPRLSIWP